MKLLIIKPHSFVDTITNSSSELFICDTKKSIEFIEESLKKMLEAYNHTTENNLDFNSVFNIKSSIPEDLTYLLLFYEPYTIQQITGEKVPQNKNYEKYDYYDKACEKYIEKHSKKVIEHYKNCIFIYSDSDNSIPYELFYLIEKAFHAERIHLG